MNLEDLKTAMYELQLDEISPQKMVDVTNDDLINALDYKFGNNTLNQRKNIKNTIIFLEELSELTYAIAYDTSRLNILEEIADVTLCIDIFIKETNMPLNITPKNTNRTGFTRKLDTTICITEIAATQKLLTKYLRNIIELKPELLKEQFCKLYASLNRIQKHYDIKPDELTMVRYIKSRRFIHNKYQNPHFVPNALLLHCDNNTDILVKFDEKTALGEPCTWLSFSDNTSLEICHEEDNLETPFYSVRLHCSEDNFDNDTYKDTCGVISTNVCNDMNAVSKTVTNIINDNIRKGVYPVNN